MNRARTRHLAIACLTATLAACGGGGGGDDESPPPPAPPAARQASGPSLVASGCNGGSTSGTFYANAEVEPFVAIHPLNPNLLLGAWQQDRWSNGGARAIVSAVSSDAGATWTRMLQPMSRCGGAAPGSAGDYERATDPWVDFGPDGTAHVMGLAFNGGSFAAGSVSAMLASRSTDGGRTWSTPATLVRDGETLFNDKNTLTADPTDSRFVYAVWDRLTQGGAGPSLIARSVDGGASWLPAEVFYIPTSGGTSQTIGNRIAVIPSGPRRGVLVNVFNQIDTVGGNSTSRVAVQASADRGVTWAAPVFIDEMRSIGARDPATGKSIRDGAVIPVIAVGPDGMLWVAWQDARFSAGARDSIAVSRSADGGQTWSAPVAVNRVDSTQAFTPTLHVRADGLVGLMHYDLRSDTNDAATLIADAWLLTTRDGVTWAETHVAGPFDMTQAPDARGLFLGDYMGLVSAGSTFLPLLVTSRLDTGNRTDVFSPALAVTLAAAVHRARPDSAMVRPAAVEARLRAGHHAAVVAAMERRIPGWAARVGARPGGDPAPR